MCPATLAIVIGLLGVALYVVWALLEARSAKEKFSPRPQVLYYFAPWCGHCKKFTPVWDEVSREMKGEADFIKIDGTTKEGREQAQAAGVTGFPHVQVTAGAATRVFSGPRTAERLKAFVRG